MHRLGERSRSSSRTEIGGAVCDPSLPKIQVVRKSVVIVSEWNV